MEKSRHMTVEQASRICKVCLERSARGDFLGAYDRLLGAMTDVEPTSREYEMLRSAMMDVCIQESQGDE